MSTTPTAKGDTMNATTTCAACATMTADEIAEAGKVLQLLG